MATITRVNGSATVAGTLYTPNSNLFIIQVKTAVPANVNLLTEDSNGGDAVVDGVVESIVKELNPLAWFTPNATSGYIYVVLDKNLNSAADLQVRIRRIGLQTNGTTSVGPNGVDISGTVVTLASTLALT